MRMCKPRSVHCEALIRRQPAGLSSSSANLHNQPRSDSQVRGKPHWQQSMTEFAALLRSWA